MGLNWFLVPGLCYIYSRYLDLLGNSINFSKYVREFAGENQQFLVLA